MRTLQEVLDLIKKPEEEWGSEEWKDGSSFSYESVVKNFCPDAEWLIVEYEGDYQGDCYMIGKDQAGRWYFFNHSYGSCSGCDELQGEGTKCFADIAKCIKEFDSKEALLEWAHKFDWTFAWRAEEEESFESKLIKRIENL